MRRGCKWCKYGRLWPFWGVWFGLCAAMMKGGGKGWGLNGVEKGMTWRWKMTGKEVLAEAGASFFVVCRMGGKRRFLS